MRTSHSRLKRTGLSICCVTLSFLLASPCVAEESILVGVSAPLTGAAASYGADIRNTLVFANERFGGGKIRLVIEDDQCDPLTAVTVAHKFVDRDHVRAVIGYGCSGALLAAAPVYGGANIPVVGTETSAAKLSGAGRHVFRTFPSDAVAARVLFESIASSHRSAGVLSEETEFAEGLLESLHQIAGAGPLMIVSTSYRSNDSDLRAQLTRLRSASIDALFLNGQTERSVYNALRQARELRITVPVYSMYLGASRAFLELAGARAEGMTVIDVPDFAAVANRESAGLLEQFESRFGAMNAWQYGFLSNVEGFQALVQALSRPEPPIETLHTATFTTINGILSFDDAGDRRDVPIAVKRIQHGRAVRLEPK